MTFGHCIVSPPHRKYPSIGLDSESRISHISDMELWLWVETLWSRWIAWIITWAWPWWLVSLFRSSTLQKRWVTTRHCGKENNWCKVMASCVKRCLPSRSDYTQVTTPSNRIFGLCSKHLAVLRRQWPLWKSQILHLSRFPPATRPLPPLPKWFIIHESLLPRVIQVCSWQLELYCCR